MQHLTGPSTTPRSQLSYHLLQNSFLIKRCIHFLYLLQDISSCFSAWPLWIEMQWCRTGCSSEMLTSASVDECPAGVQEGTGALFCPWGSSTLFSTVVTPLCLPTHCMWGSIFPHPKRHCLGVASSSLVFFFNSQITKSSQYIFFR